MNFTNEEIGNRRENANELANQIDEISASENPKGKVKEMLVKVFPQKKVWNGFQMLIEELE